MGNYYSLRDGLITDTSTYGTSISGVEKTNSSNGYTLTTSDSWSTSLVGTTGEVVDSIAVHVSSRAATPVGVLNVYTEKWNGPATKVGTVPLSSDSPFGEGTDGSIISGGYVSFPAGSGINLGTGDFTIEGWFKHTSTATGRIFSIGQAATNSLQLISISTTVRVYTSDAAILITSATGMNNGQWHHFALCRTGGNSLILYIDGVQSGGTSTTTISFNLGQTNPLTLGGIANAYTGSISNFRLIKGTAIYPASPFPTAPLSLVANTSILYQYPYDRSYKGPDYSAPVLAGTWPISAFTSYDGSNNTVATYPLNWQLLKLSTPFTNSTGVFKINLTTSNSNQLTLMADSITGGVDCNRLIIRDTYISTPITNLYIGGIIDGYSTVSRTITANTGNFGDIYVHKNGLLKFSDTSATLTISGSNGLQVTSEGTIEIGNSANYVPYNTTHEIKLSGNHIGVSNGGRLDVYGAYKLPHTKFSQYYNSGVNSFNTVDVVSSSWKSGDSLVFIPNTTANNTTELFTIAAGAGFIDANTFSIFPNNNTFPHPVLSYLPNVANLTRNVKIGGFSNSAKGNIQARSGAIVNINNTELKHINGSLYTGVNSSGLFSLSGCTLSGNGTETLLTPIADEFAAIFNGTSSSIKTPANNQNYKIESNKNFTFEVFVKLNTISKSMMVFRVGAPTASSATGSTGSAIFSRILANGSFYFGHVRADNGVAVYDTTPANVLKVGKWYHIAAVGNNNAIKVYINGILQASSLQNTINFYNTFIAEIGKYTSTGAPEYFDGKMSNLRFVNGQAIYTTNFTPPTAPLAEITGSGITTALLTLQNSTPIDNSSNNATLTNTNITSELDTPFGRKSLNCSIKNNVLFKTKYGIYLENVYSDNNTIEDNLILSSKNAGVYIDDGLKGNISFNNNISIGPSPYGSFVSNNTQGTKLDNLVNYNNTYGTYVYNAHSGQIDNVINTYNTIVGVLVDGTASQLNETVFTDITASNNKTTGFLVSGNPIDHLSPIIINVNGLIANDNLSGGFEGYCIAGNLSSLELNRNGIYGMKTSIGNYNTTIDGVTALMNNVATVSAAIGILSGTCYYPILIKNANVGKLEGSSVFGAGISLDSTKFSEFSVENSTVSGGSSDFQLRTTRSILEGSYLISNTNVGVLPVGIGVSTSNYQSDVLKTTGFAFTNMNNVTGYHVTYLAAGNRSIDSTITNNIDASTSPSERLTPQSNSLKLRSGSKFVALNAGESTSVRVYIRKSTVATNGVAYNGTAPRLILKRNGAMGIDSDLVMDQLDTTSENFLKLSGTTPAVTDDGVLEFYIDCDGTQGWINIDNWTAN